MNFASMSLIVALIASPLSGLNRSSISSTEVSASRALGGIRLRLAGNVRRSLPATRGRWPHAPSPYAAPCVAAQISSKPSPGPVRCSRRANSGHDQDPDAAQFEQEASGTLRSLSVVRVPLPEFAS
jgi:hypothetical protein